MSLKPILENHPEKRYIMFGGKGGLGKTTFSAATAYHLAKQGRKVLVFSVDPQASLSDIFQRDIFGRGAVEIMPNLYAQEVDADRRVREYQDEIRGKILDRYGLEEVPEEIESYIRAAAAEPAMEESAIFDAVVDIVTEGEYEYYVYDLVPLGHALYYLSMASIYDAWIDKVTGLREQMQEYDRVISKMRSEDKMEEDEILEELQYIKKRINTASQIFTDRERTCFFFVLTPEEMSILDTQKAYGLFAKFDVPIAGSVVNRVLPENLLSSDAPAYIRNKVEAQKKPLEDIRRVFDDQVLGYVPEFERDIVGFDMIEKVAARLFE